MPLLADSNARYTSENPPPSDVTACAGTAEAPVCAYTSGKPFPGLSINRRHVLLIRSQSGTDGCPAGCTDDGVTCGGVATTPTCDIDPATDGTADCPYGCTPTKPRFPGVWLRPHDPRLILSRGGPSGVDPCTGYVRGAPGVPSTSCPSPRCTLAGDGATETCAETVSNVALNKVASGSTEYATYTADKAVDGSKPASSAGKPFCIPDLSIAGMFY